MTNIVNGTASALARFSARNVRRLTGLPTGTVTIKNWLGTREMVVAGQGDGRVNRGIFNGLPVRAMSGNEVNLVQARNFIEKEFHPQTVREVLQKMSEYLGFWGHEPVADYFFRFAGQGGHLYYGKVVNTAKARSAILAAAFEDRPLAKFDRKIAAGEISGPVNNTIHLYKLHKYSLGLLMRLGIFSGSPKTFIALPVRDAADRVIGKVNIGLRETRRLSADELRVLELLAGKIKETRRDDDSDYQIDAGKVKQLVEQVRRTRLYKFLLVPDAVAKIMKMLVDLLSDSMEHVVAMVLKGERDKERALQELIETLASTIDAREEYTGGHCSQVARWVAELGQVLPDEVWEEEMVRMDVPKELRAQTIAKARESLFIASLNHDLGKIHLPDAILNSTEAPTQADWEKIREHPEIGAKIIKRAQERYGKNPLVAQAALDAVLMHHVDYNGEGYPDVGLRGKALPLIARLLRVVDSYHTMISRRKYKKAGTPEFIVKELVKGVGTYYDPTVARSQLRLLPDSEAARVDLMMEEIFKELSEIKNSRPDDLGNKYVLEQLMAKLRGGARVAELDQVMANLRKEGMLVTGPLRRAGDPPVTSEELYRRMTAAMEEKKAELVRRAGASLEFYDTVLVRLTGVLAEFQTDGHYSADAVRQFLGQLFAVWSDNREEGYITQVTQAFDNAVARPDQKNDPDGSKIRHFREFFFENLSTSQPHPTAPAGN